MKKLLPFLVIVALLALLLIATVTVSAAGKGNGKGKGNAGGKDDAGGGEKVVICHQPGTSVQKTMEVPAAAVPGHLQHGDSLGPCVEEPIPPPSPPPTDTITATVKVTICHKPGTPAEKTLELPMAAVPGHLQHGDSLGPCVEEPIPPPTPPPTDTITATVKVTICHKPGTRAEKTLHIDATSTADHLGHGDYLGVCGEAPPEFTAWLMPNFWWLLLRRLLPI